MTEQAHGRRIFQPGISTGNVLVLLSLAGGGLTTFVTLQNMAEANVAAISRNEAEIGEQDREWKRRFSELELRVRMVEQGAGRMDERLANIIDAVRDQTTAIKALEASVNSAIREGKP